MRPITRGTENGGWLIRIPEGKFGRRVLAIIISAAVAFLYVWITTPEKDFRLSGSFEFRRETLTPQPSSREPQSDPPPEQASRGAETPAPLPSQSAIADAAILLAMWPLPLVERKRPANMPEPQLSTSTRPLKPDVSPGPPLPLDPIELASLLERAMQPLSFSPTARALCRNLPTVIVFGPESNQICTSTHRIH